MKNSDIERIINQIKKHLENNERIIALIGGNSRAGKSTLAHRLLEYFNLNGIMAQDIELDNWIISVDQRTEEMDVFDRFNTKQIERDLKKLFNGHEIELEAYDADSRGTKRVLKKIKLIEKGVVIIDGVVALGMPYVNENAMIRIYIDLDEDIRKRRMFKLYKDKGLNDNEIEKLYFERQKDEFEVIKKTKVNANIVLKG